MFLMRDEKEERKKQARSNKQTRQSNTAHPRQSLFLEKMSCHVHVQCTCMYMYIVGVQVHEGTLYMHAYMYILGGNLRYMYNTCMYILHNNFQTNCTCTCTCKCTCDCLKPCSQSDGTANVAFRKLIGRPLRRLR